MCFSYASYSAHVAEVSVAEDGAVRVHRLVCAIDCGIAVNPDQVKAQMEGGAVYAMTAALYGQITLDAGPRPADQLPHLSDDADRRDRRVTEVHILDSGQPPGGLGEPGVPTVAPAICNAIFAATGKRIRRCRSTGRRSSAPSPGWASRGVAVRVGPRAIAESPGRAAGVIAWPGVSAGPGSLSDRPPAAPDDPAPRSVGRIVRYDQ